MMAFVEQRIDGAERALLIQLAGGESR
jgi:hypothetical protein